MESNLTSDKLEEFVSQTSDFFSLKVSDQIDYFVYYLAEILKIEVSQAAIKNCFILLRLKPYSNIGQYLILGAKAKPKISPKFIKTKEKGYQLHRNLKATIEGSLNLNPLKAKISNDLTELLNHVNRPEENEFLKEALNCFSIGAYRASTVMVWNLTIDHLYEFILKHQLVSFNSALSKNTDKRIKITAVTSKDDFGEIPEGKFIEFCRSSSIISNDIRKILELKLGIRNTYAHPSNVKMLESKAIEFIEDLITNVIIKFKI